MCDLMRLPADNGKTRLSGRRGGRVGGRQGSRELCREGGDGVITGGVSGHICITMAGSFSEATAAALCQPHLRVTYHYTLKRLDIEGLAEVRLNLNDLLWSASIQKWL